MKKTTLAAMLYALAFSVITTRSYAQIENSRLENSQKLAAIAPTAVQASSSPFDVTVSHEDYKPLENPTVLEDYNWDDAHGTVSLGFNYHILGETFNSGNVFDGSFNLYDGSNYVVVWATRGDFFSLDSGSPVSYELSGEPGDQILKLEWKNVGMVCRQNNGIVEDDYLSMQLWLYDNGDKFELRIGPSLVQAPDVEFCYDGGPVIGAAWVKDSSVNAYLLTGNPQAPKLENIIRNSHIGAPLPHLESFPSVGTVYAFTPNNTGIKHIEANTVHVNIYPNPAKEKLFVRLQDEKHAASIRITDISGKIMLEKCMPYQTLTSAIDIEAWPKGMYLVQVVTENGVRTERFVKE